MKEILFKLGLFGTEAARPASERVLNAALQLLYIADCEYLKAHPDTPSIYTPGLVRYLREPIFPQPIEEWKAIPFVLEDGEGDCEDLACWRAAQSTVQEGIPAVPVFSFRRFRDPRNGSTLSIYHIVVQLPNRQIDDPSRRLGMK